MIAQAALLAVALVAAHPAAADPPSPASGHAAVVAQGLVSFADGEHHWELTTATVTATHTLDVPGATFVVADGPGGLLVGPTGEPPAWRLAAGEASFHSGDASLDVQSVVPTGGDVTVISPALGTGTNPFTPGEGVRDVDLVRDVLSTNEALLLATDVSAFVTVTVGTVDAGGTPIAGGSSVALSGDITLINRGPEVAIVLAAVFGPLVGGETAPGSTPSPATSGPATPSGTAPAPGPTPPTPTAAPRPSTTTSTTSTTTTTVAAVDSDGDNLTDAEEAALGTKPNDADSDRDGIDDGREVNALGSNPLDTDTDSDGLTDALEVDHSCGINQPDSDGDGLGDAFEANSGFSECSLSNTDGDSLDDLAEFSVGSDPRDPSSPQP